MSRNKKTSIIANINLFLSHQQAPTINFTINSTKPCKTKLALLSNSSTRSAVRITLTVYEIQES